MPQYWQVAAGNATQHRDYSHLFLKYGMAFVGGGEQVELMDQVEEGDILILKQGLLKVKAAGKVVERGGTIGAREGKQWLEDVEGWDLPCYRYVEWHQPPQPIDTENLARSTINRSHDPRHQHIADELLKLPPLPYDPEPDEPQVITQQEWLSQAKADRPNIEIERALSFLEDATRLYHVFVTARDWDADQVRDNLVIPFLESLGWRKHQIRSELKRQRLGHGICCFPDDVRPAASGVVPVECRPFYDGVDLHLEQAQAYGQVFTSAPALFVTNGIAYKLYSLDRNAKMFKTHPSAYCNISRPSLKYAADPNVFGGAATVLKWLAKP